MSLPSLYTLSHQYQSLKTLALSDDIDEQTLADTLEGLEGDLQVKGANVAAFALNLRAMRDLLTDAAAKLAQRAKVADNHYARVCNYLQSCMEATGTQKISSDELVASIRKNPPSVMVDPAAVLPERFMKPSPPPPPPSPDKRAIGDALKAGEEIPGCQLVYSTRLEIK